MSVRVIVVVVVLAATLLAGLGLIYATSQDNSAILQPADNPATAQVAAATDVPAPTASATGELLPVPAVTATAERKPQVATLPDWPAANVAMDRVLVDPAARMRTISPDFFGINYVAFWDDAQGSAASAKALAQTPIKTIRFPGGVVADNYDWQQPYYEGQSKTSPADLWRYARSFGATHVVFGTNYRGHLPNPPGKSYGVNSPENAAAWVAYNKTLGIPADMEVGNEEDLATMHKADDPAFAPYITGFNAQARAMHTADPGVRVLGPAGVNEYYWWALDSLGMFLKGTGNRHGSGQVDGVSLHFYAGNTWFDSKSAAQEWLAPGGPWAAIQKMIHADDTRDLPVYLTEWNLGSSDSNNAFTPTLGHALATADLIGAFAQSGVAGEDYYSTHGAGGWGLLYGQDEDRPVDSPTPTYYSMVLWGHMGNQLLRLSQSDDPARVMSTYATTRDDGSVQLLAINKLGTARTLSLTLDGATPAGHHLSVYSLSGISDSMEDIEARYNGVTMPSPQQQLPDPVDGSSAIRGDTVTYIVPGYSAVVLDLDGTTPAPHLTAMPAPAVASAPAPRISVSSSVGRSSLQAGETQSLTLVVRSNYDLGHSRIDLEVFDSSNAKVFQGSQIENLAVDMPITVTQVYTLTNNAYDGTYYYKVGIFGPDWKPNYYWNEHAGRFYVRGRRLPPHVSALGWAGPQRVTVGATVTLTATVTSALNSLSNAIVDFEVYSYTGIKLCQPISTGVDVPANGSTTVVQHCAIPPGQQDGSYMLRLGVFGADWSPRYWYAGDVASFTVASG